MTATVTPSEQELRRELELLIDDARASCLWYLRPDYFPVGPEEVERTLVAIEREGNRETFLRARQLRQWFSATSSARSAAS